MIPDIQDPEVVAFNEAMEIVLNRLYIFYDSSGVNDNGNIAR